MTDFVTVSLTVNLMTKPTPSTPLRHRLRVDLDAPVAEVWPLVGDHRRLPEYSAGIAAVDVEPGVRICHFHGGPTLRERIVWEAPGVGYATSAEPGNDFGLEQTLSLVTVTATPTGTRFSWDEHYDSADLPASRASYDDGFADMAERLIARFGGRLVERFLDGPRA